MDNLTKGRVKQFLEGLARLSQETGVEINANGEIDLYDTQSRRYIAGLLIDDLNLEVWIGHDETPELVVERPQE